MTKPKPKASVSTMTELDNQAVSHLLWWMQERHRIYLKRKAGEPKPWSTHPVLQRYFFTNPYRENDKTTVWFRENVRDRLRNHSDVLMATFIFRRFNYIPTGELLSDAGLLQRWDSNKACDLLAPLATRGTKIFTGAYMMSSPAGKQKLPEILRMINAVWVNRASLLSEMERAPTLAAAWKALQFEHHKGLLPYEVVTDLRHTYLLRKATDIMTWAYFGPGGQRGACRMIGKEVKRKGAFGGRPSLDTRSLSQQECLDIGRAVLKIANESKMECGGQPMTFEMRDIEHSMCETDKFLRMCHGTGQSKRVYDGV